MAVMCREFGISRKTAYKIFNRYKEIGLDGLHDQSRRPLRYANQMPFRVERRILAIKWERPTWGAPKIREKHKDVVTRSSISRSSSTSMAGQTGAFSALLLGLGRVSGAMMFPAYEHQWRTPLQGR